jgi:hypothetical protein
MLGLGHVSTRHLLYRQRAQKSWVLCALEAVANNSAQKPARFRLADCQFTVPGFERLGRSQPSMMGKADFVVVHDVRCCRSLSYL